MSKAQHFGSGVGRLTEELTGLPFNGVKVFSATMMNERDRLGERVTEWLRQNPHIRTTDAFVTQSSDESFHCIAITVFYWEDGVE